MAKSIFRKVVEFLMIPVPLPGNNMDMQAFADASKTYMEAVRGESSESNQEVHYHQNITNNHLHVHSDSKILKGKGRHSASEKLISTEDHKLLDYSKDEKFEKMKRIN